MNKYQASFISYQEDKCKELSLAASVQYVYTEGLKHNMWVKGWPVPGSEKDLPAYLKERIKNLRKRRAAKKTPYLQPFEYDESRKFADNE